MRKLLFIYEPAYRRLQAQLADLADCIDILCMREDGSLSGDGQPQIAWSNADLFGSPNAAPFNQAMVASPRLEWVQTASAGLDSPLFARILDKGARLSNSNAQAVGMAEFVLHGVLDRFQRGDQRRALQAERVWRKTPFREVAGTTWLIIGFGAIGQAVAQRARAFGARIVGIRRSAGGHPLADEMHAPAALADQLPTADVVVLSLPLNDASRGLVDARFLARMKPGSVLVNVSRGAMVDETALIAALDRGAPSDAVLDVFATEPLPPQSPLWSHPKVAVNPHASALSSGLQQRGDALFLRNLRLFLDGRPLETEVGPGDL
jgi:phosphoglycerate dehydrogenase-like enzyme